MATERNSSSSKQKRRKRTDLTSLPCWCKAVPLHQQGKQDRLFLLPRFRYLPDKFMMSRALSPRWSARDRHINCFVVGLTDSVLDNNDYELDLCALYHKITVWCRFMLFIAFACNFISVFVVLPLCRIVSNHLSALLFRFRFPFFVTSLGLLTRRVKIGPYYLDSTVCLPDNLSPGCLMSQVNYHS